MNPTSGTPQTDPPTQAHAQVSQPVAPAPTPEPPGFRSRGRARRRARFLRKARELAYRDLGGLVFNLHRFGARNDALVLAKLTTIGHIDAELRAIEAMLQERRPVTVLREAGITTCPRCAAIHSSEDGFCPNCGLPVNRHVDLPADFQSSPSAATAPSAAAPAAAAPSPTPQPIAANPTPPPAPPASAPAAAPAAPAPATSAPATSVMPRPPDPAEQDSPTEIIHPPVPGS